MILDAHTHIGKKTIVASAEDLVKSMDKAGIDKSLVFAGKINEQTTEALLEDIAPFKGRLYGIGSTSPFTDDGRSRLMLPNDPVPMYIDRMLAENQIVGVKFYVGYEHFYPNNKALASIYHSLIKYDRPAIFHSGDCFSGVCGAKLKYAHPLNIDELAVDYPKLKIIIAHMGYPWVRDAAEVCYKNPNVFSDMSGFVYGDFNQKDRNNYRFFIEEFVRIAGGTDKLIFGTDWPISNQDSYIQTMREMMAIHLNLWKGESDEIMGLRAAKLFGII